MKRLATLSDNARRDLAFAALTLALFLAVTFAFPGFAAPRNLAGLLDDTAILIMLALGADAGHPRARHRPVDRRESRAVRHAGRAVQSGLARQRASRRCSRSR